MSIVPALIPPLYRPLTVRGDTLDWEPITSIGMPSLTYKIPIYSACRAGPYEKIDHPLYPHLRPRVFLARENGSKK
jgi:hypothetical protein